MKEKKLLSIAIPTYCRSEHLNNALEILLPQIEPLEEFIQLVISDNASSDNTQEVINKFILLYPSVEIVTYLHKENTGLYGNFKKCKELATGNYLWLLSDDDHITQNLLLKIIEVLSANDNLAWVFLNDWVTSLPKSPIKYTTSEILNFNTFISTVKNKFTLISANIFKNNDYINDKMFEGNNFYGLALSAAAKKYSNNAIIIYGPSLLVKQEQGHSYNFFKAFIEDLNEVTKYMLSIGFSKQVMAKFRSEIIRNIIFTYFYLYKSQVTNKTISFNEKDKVKDVQNRLLKTFKSDAIFWIKIYPIILIPASILASLVKIKRKINGELFK